MKTRRRRRPPKIRSVSGVPRTLSELFQTREAYLGPTWSPAYARQQKNWAEFWCATLGANKLIDTVTEAEIEAISSRAAQEKSWSPSTHYKCRRFMADSFSYGVNKLRWMTRDQELRLSMPSLDGVQRPRYTPVQAHFLLRELERRDLRAAFVAHAYIQAGRRLTANRLIKTSDVKIIHVPGPAGGDVVEINYNADHDKAKRQGTAILVGDAVHITRKLLDKKLVKVSHYLCPGGHGGFSLDRLPKPTSKRLGAYQPVGTKYLLRVLHDAEAALKIPHIPRRGYHAFKRLFADLSNASLVAAHQAGTTQETLSRIYSKDAPVQARAALSLSILSQIHNAATPRSA